MATMPWRSLQLASATTRVEKVEILVKEVNDKLVVVKKREEQAEGRALEAKNQLSK